MTNGEKMLNTFQGEVTRCDETVFFTTGGWHHAYDAEWWNAEYKEPTKNDSEIDIAIKIIKADDLAPYSVEDILKARDLAVEALKQMGTTKNDSKFCPDRKAKTTHMETLLHCVEDECVAYKDGKCLKYNSNQEPTTKNDSSELEKNSKKLEKGTTKNDLGVNREQLKTMIRGLAKWYVKRDNTEVGEPNTAVGLLYDDVMFGIDRLPSVTPQLSVPEVTALAEWTAKLTKASEDAYNKGYADGMKAQEPRKGHWIYDYTSADGHRTYHCSECGCFLKPKHSEPLNSFNWCSLCGADMREVKE